ncbi:MAG: hypothetical protein ACUVTU_12640 [Desulfurispora sp.]|uniref:hypothetical protein n=1 Tax=Desulfurispora sp. TaxID=3014275 RepID=UPI00404A69C0
MTGEEALKTQIYHVQEDLREIKADLKEMRRDHSESLKRVHQRLDEFANRDPVSRRECEQCRQGCAAQVEQKIKESRGYPAWVALLLSLCSGLAVYALTR